MKVILNIKYSLLYKLFLLIIWGWTSNLFAATDFSTRSFRTITSSNGLSSNIVNAIYKDKLGFLWLGTQTGLNRFDGIHITNYPQLSGRAILSICESDSINLWIGTDTGLIRFDRKYETVHPVSFIHSSLKVNVIWHDKQAERLLIGTNSGLFIWQNGESHHIILGPDISSSYNHITGIAAGEEGIFWITSYSGLIRYDSKKNESSVYDNSINNSFSCIVYKNKKLYIGTRGNGLFTFDTHKLRFYPHPSPGFENGDIKTLVLANEKDLLIGTNGNGIQIIDTQTRQKTASIEHTLRENGLCSNAVYALLVSNDVLFVGTYMGGMSYTPSCRNLFSIYQWKNIFSSEGLNVRAFWIDESKRIKIIGTRDGLYYISESNNHVKHYTRKNSVLRSDIILTVIPFKEDYLIGTYGGGLYLLSSSTGILSFFKQKTDFCEGSFNGYVQDHEKRLWLGSSKGIYIYDEKTDSYYQYNNQNSSLSQNTVFTIKSDSEGRIWIGAYGELFLYNSKSGTFTSSIFPDSLSSYIKSIRYIYEDFHQNLWFCDDTEGVLKVNANLTQFEHYTIDNLLPSNSVMNITERSITDGMWFATQNGLLYYDKKRNKAMRFSLYDGLPGYVFNHPVQVTQDGTIWWGNEKGLVYYKNGNILETKNEWHRPPTLTSVSVSGNTLSPNCAIMAVSPAFANQINLPANNNNLSFTFSALNYAKEDAVIYEYCLEGLEKSWQTLTRGNQVSYTNLPYGEYLFKIRTTSFPEAVRTIKISVQRPHFPILWSIVAISLSICIIWILSYSRLRKKYHQLKIRIKKGVRQNVPEKEKYQKSKIESSTATSIYERLTLCMEKERLFLNPNLKLQDVADAIRCSSGEISQTLNIFMNTNFTDFVNQYRIDEFIRQVQEDTSHKYTLSSLSEQCGFSSRTSFFRSFKKQKGMSPAEYIKIHISKS